MDSEWLGTGNFPLAITMHGILPRMKTRSTLLSCLAASLLLTACATSNYQAPRVTPQETPPADPLSQLLSTGELLAAATLLEVEASEEGLLETRVAKRFQAAHLFIRADDSAGLLRICLLYTSDAADEN